MSAERDLYRWATMAVAGLLVAVRAAGGETSLHANDCEWSVQAIRTASSVLCEIPVCQGVTGGADREFKSEHGELSVVRVELKSKKAGRLALIPELFLVRDGGLYGVYRPCLGVRMVRPAPAPEAAAFHPPAQGRQWPGHAGWIDCAAGDSVVVDLLFDEIVSDAPQLLAASPVTGWGQVLKF